VGGPDRGRMSSHCEQMDPAGAHLHHEQNIESAQGDGVEGEDIGGQQTRGRSPKEGPPPVCLCSTGCQAESGGGQDLPDRASAYAVAEPVSSPWIRRWPQEGFSWARCSTRVRISSLLIGGRH
jgi:hypothetical protein